MLKTISEAQLAAAICEGHERHEPDTGEPTPCWSANQQAAAIFAALPESKATVMKVRTSAGEDYTPGQQAQVSSALPDTGLAIEAAAPADALLRALVEAIDPPEGGDFTARSFRELKAAIAAARAYLEGQK